MRQCSGMTHGLAIRMRGRTLRGLRASIVVAVVMASLALASIAGGTSEPTVVFSSLPAGWSTNDAYALSWKYRPNSLGWAPSMPRNGIVVTVIFPGRPKVGYPPSLKLVIPKKPSTTLEGAPDTPEYRIKGSVDGRDVWVFVDIRSAHPTRAQLAAAQRVVTGIHFARP